MSELRNSPPYRVKERLCPTCNRSLIRVRRSAAERELRDIDSGSPLHRYRCGSADCDWQGLLPLFVRDHPPPAASAPPPARPPPASAKRAHKSSSTAPRATARDPSSATARNPSPTPARDRPPAPARSRSSTAGRERPAVKAASAVPYRRRPPPTAWDRLRRSLRRAKWSGTRMAMLASVTAIVLVTGALIGHWVQKSGHLPAAVSAAR